MIYWKNNTIHNGLIKQCATSPAFRFGVGFYETILFNGTALVNASAHMDRVTKSMRSFDFSYKPVDIHSAVSALLEQNNIKGMARVNVFYTQEQPVDSEESPVLEPTVLAAPYTPPPMTKQFSLCLAKNIICSPWHEYKTTNHMPHAMERYMAKKQGFDDAVFFLSENTLLETTTASLVFSDGKTFVTPPFANRLAGTAEALVKQVLYITYQPIKKEHLHRFSHAYVINSLMGARSVSGLAGHMFSPDIKTCEKLSQVIQDI